ncbi:phage scaffolding protein [Viridibacillus sp. NPDC096237]|uniref:phage scaffolding protein n=1 Tax=Viridibacillus sp. NPDC096237 TaxID=3390721 RepID=UPI003D05B059
MKKEDLVALGLTEEQADKVVAGYGAMIPKTRFDEINTAKKQLETDLALRDQQLEELKKVDAAGLQVKITELQTANTEAKTAYEQQLKDVQLSSAIKLALTGKAQDAEIVAGILDTTKIELDENGSIKGGLDDQLKTLKESKPFLFVSEEGGAPGFKGVTPVEGAQSTKTETKAGDYGKQMAENFSQSNKGLEDARKSYFE